MRAAAEVFADAGAHVEQVDPGFADPVDAFHALWFTGAAKVVAPYGRRARRVDPGLRRVVERGRGVIRRGLPGRRPPRGWTSACGWAGSTARTTCC